MPDTSEKIYRDLKQVVIDHMLEAQRDSGVSFVDGIASLLTALTGLTGEIVALTAKAMPKKTEETIAVSMASIKKSLDYHMGMLPTLDEWRASDQGDNIGHA